MSGASCKYWISEMLASFIQQNTEYYDVYHQTPFTSSEGSVAIRRQSLLSGAGQCNTLCFVERSPFPNATQQCNSQEAVVIPRDENSL